MCSYVWLFLQFFFFFSVQQLLFQFFCFVLPYFILTVVLFGFVFSSVLLNIGYAWALYFIKFLKS